MTDGWGPYAKLKDTIACSTSTMLLPPFGSYSACVSGALLSPGAEVGPEETSGMGQQWLQITCKTKQHPELHPPTSPNSLTISH